MNCTGNRKHNVNQSLHLALKPFEYVGVDLLAVDLVQYLVARLGIKLELEIAHPSACETVAGAAHADTRLTDGIRAARDK